MTPDRTEKARMKEPTRCQPSRGASKCDSRRARLAARTSARSVSFGKTFLSSLSRQTRSLPARDTSFSNRSRSPEAFAESVMSVSSEASESVRRIWSALCDVSLSTKDTRRDAD